MNWKKHFLKVNETLFVPVKDIAWVEIMTTGRYCEKYPEFYDPEKPMSMYMIVFFQNPIQKKYDNEKFIGQFRGHWLAGPYLTKIRAIKALNKIWRNK